MASAMPVSVNRARAAVDALNGRRKENNRTPARRDGVRGAASAAKADAQSPPMPGLTWRQRAGRTKAANARGVPDGAAQDGSPRPVLLPWVQAAQQMLQPQKILPQA